MYSTNIIVNDHMTTFAFKLKVTDDENGFMWTVYDNEGAHLYCENYDPDTVHPENEALSFCEGYVAANYS